MIDLDDVETIDLIDALLKRFDHAIFAGVSERRAASAAVPLGEQSLRNKWKGTHLMAMGLCADLQCAIHKCLRARSQEEPPLGGESEEDDGRGPYTA